MATNNDISLPSTSSDPFDPFCRGSSTDNELSAKPKFEGDKFPSNSSAIMSQGQSGTRSGTDSPDFQGFVGAFGSPLSCHAIRLKSGQEFRKSLMDFVSTKNLKAPFIMSCVGSAMNAKLRLANATAEDTNYLLDLQGPLEIISVNGTFSSDGKCHLHASFSNSSGKVHGGHLIELIVHTTAEVIIGECTAMKFERVLDKQTGFPELVIKDR